MATHVACEYRRFSSAAPRDEDEKRLYSQATTHDNQSNWLTKQKASFRQFEIRARKFHLVLL